MLRKLKLGTNVKADIKMLYGRCYYTGASPGFWFRGVARSLVQGRARIFDQGRRQDFRLGGAKSDFGPE